MKQPTLVCASDFDRTTQLTPVPGGTGAFEIKTSGGGLAVEHGHIATCDGVLVAESFQTRLTTTG